MVRARCGGAHVDVAHAALEMSEGDRRFQPFGDAGTQRGKKQPLRNFLLGGDQKEFSIYYAYAIFAKLSRKRTANVTKKPRERFTDTG